MTFPLTTYIEAALEMAHYDKLEDGSFAGEIPKLKGVIAFGKSLRECENELRSTLEDWILVGLRLGHKLPVVAGVDLNKLKHGALVGNSWKMLPGFENPRHPTIRGVRTIFDQKARRESQTSIRCSVREEL